MYQIKQNGSVIGYSDDVIFVRLHENGCYVPCERAQAGGFCVKVPVDYTEENGETKTRLEDFVYKFLTMIYSASNRRRPWSNSAAR